MKRAWILIAATAALLACNKSDKSEATPAASATAVASAESAASAAPTAAAVATKPTLNAQGDIVDPTLPAAAEAENTSDITAGTYKKDLDSLNKEIADLK